MLQEITYLFELTLGFLKEAAIMGGVYLLWYRLTKQSIMDPSMRHEISGFPNSIAG